MSNKIIKKFISLGPNCCIRLRIDAYLKKNRDQYGESNFFDWNLVDLNCVQTFFNSNIKAKDYFFKENISTGTIDDKFYAELKNLYFRSIHDIDIKNVNNDKDIDFQIENYIHKYVRRHERFLKIANDAKPAVYICMSDISKESFGFIKNNNNIKNKIFICLNDYGPDQELSKEEDQLYKINYFYLYNTKNENTIKFIKKTNWTYMEFIDWEKVFEMIINIYINRFKVKYY